MRPTGERIFVKAIAICAVAVLRMGLSWSGGDSDRRSAPTVKSATVTPTSVPRKTATAATEIAVETASEVVSLAMVASYKVSKV